MCNKVAYPDKSAAKADAKLIHVNNARYSRRRVGRAGKKHGRKMSAYLCKRCGQWHLTVAKQRKG